MRKLVLFLIFFSMAGHVEAKFIDNAISLFPVMSTEDEPQDAVYQDYKAAYNLVLDQRWSEAITGLEAFSKKYPNTKYTDDAQFWLCYSREKRGDNPEQVFEAYEKFIQKFSSSQYVDDARSNMIRLADQLAKAGNPKYKARLEALRSSEDEDLKLQAIYALSQYDDPSTAKTLIELVQTEKNANLRRKIV